MPDNEKNLRFDTAKIRALSLLFENKALEDRWDSSHKSRLKSMTVRYLFASGLFQGMFFWSDVLESRNDSHLAETLLLKSAIRLALGGVPLILCFVYAIGIVAPSQMTVFIANLLYGIPTLALYILSRRAYSHWDSLFLIYGLAFFMLPKLSPLNFIYGVSGSMFLSLMYTYLSAFRLSLQEWLLSNFLLGIIFILMGYLSYSTEKASRERWLLKERLQKEKISVKLVASSIQDDLRRAANEERLHRAQRMAELGSIKDEVKSVATNLALRAPGFMRRGVGQSSVDPTSSAFKDTNEDIFRKDSHSKDTIDKQKSIDLKKNLALFFKGLLAWAIIVLLSYTFDMVSRSHNFNALEGEDLDLPQGEANTSAAFALLMHTSGFSVFLLYFTGQIRWLLINGLVGLSLMWVLNQSGMEQKWVVFGTHTAGYVILVVVVVTMILVFGGVVLVWTNLIDFLKDILNRYPQVMNDLSENKLLEQVIVTYISQLPYDQQKSERDGQNMSLQVMKGGADEESSTRLVSSDSAHAPSYGGGKKGKKGKVSGRERSSSASSESIHSSSGVVAPHDVLLPATGRYTCYFCLKSDERLCYVPACAAWRRPNPEPNFNSLTSYSACTSFAEMSMARNDALLQSKQVTADWLHMSEMLKQQEGEKESSKRRAETTLRQANRNIEELEKQLQTSKREIIVQAEKLEKKRMDDIQEIKRAHQLFVEEQRVSADRDMNTLMRQLHESKCLLNERETELETMSRELQEKRFEAATFGGVQPQHQPQPRPQPQRGKTSSFDSGNNGQLKVLEKESVISQSVPHLNKHGVDISSRNVRRNMNNPNNPNYNPKLRKGQKREEGNSGQPFVGSSSDSNANSGTRRNIASSSLYDLDGNKHQSLPPGLTRQGALGSLDNNFSPYLSEDSVGDVLRMNTYEQLSQSQSVSQKSSHSLLEAGSIPVYNGTLNLRLEPPHNLEGNSLENLNTPVSQREVITNVITSLALDDVGDEDGSLKAKSIQH